jgi:hypothetical protein
LHDQFLQGPYSTSFQTYSLHLLHLPSGAQFKWMDDCQHSFNELKCLLTKQTVLTYPGYTIPFEIYTDTSNKQIGLVIQQSGWHLAFCFKIAQLVNPNIKISLAHQTQVIFVSRLTTRFLIPIFVPQFFVVHYWVDNESFLNKSCKDLAPNHLKWCYISLVQL